MLHPKGLCNQGDPMKFNSCFVNVSIVQNYFCYDFKLSCVDHMLSLNSFSFCMCC